jgi:uncharacterized membrane protein
VNAIVVVADAWRGHMMGGDGGGGWWWWLPMSLVMLAGLALVLVLVARMAAPHRPVDTRDDEARSARVIAMERYARGEIGADEYDALVQRLR